MSKYSTAELVRFMESRKLFVEIETYPNEAIRPFQKVYVEMGDPVRDAIIARLRAADKLCEAAKDVDNDLSDPNNDGSVLNSTKKIFRKAIANYESSQ